MTRYPCGLPLNFSFHPRGHFRCIKAKFWLEPCSYGMTVQACVARHSLYGIILQGLDIQLLLSNRGRVSDVRFLSWLRGVVSVPAALISVRHALASAPWKRIAALTLPPSHVQLLAMKNCKMSSNGSENRRERHTFSPAGFHLSFARPALICSSHFRSAVCPLHRSLASVDDYWLSYGTAKSNEPPKTADRS